MVATRTGSAFVLVLLAGIATIMLLSAPLASLPSISLPVARQASTFSIHSNWGELELDVDGALEHATTRHGQAGAEALRMAQQGQCMRAFLECGVDWQHLVDGAAGYFVCRLGDGRMGLVPFRADAIKQTLVAMTGFPIRPGYEDYVAKRDGCAPIELMAILLAGGGDYADR